MLRSHLLADTVQFTSSDALLILNSAADPFVSLALQRLHAGTLTLAEDNIASIEQLMHEARPGSAAPPPRVRHVAFHDYILHHPAADTDIAVMNLLYQPNNAWMHYGLRVAAYALRPQGRLYVTGAKDRGIMTIARCMQELFGNVETLEISKGHRVVCSHKCEQTSAEIAEMPVLNVFANNKLDEGTRLLLDALEVRVTDEALDMGCGAGFIGLHIARLATKGRVTMVDTSLAAVATAQQAIDQSGLNNIHVLPSDGIKAICGQRFSLVATNPPFHLGGIQTTQTAVRFIYDASQVLVPRGRFYLVANRFLKYEPTLRDCFDLVEEIAGDARYKVLLAGSPRRS
jgi:16S rRNA (guanine1207-N2)-methyltransferase